MEIIDTDRLKSVLPPDGTLLQFPSTTRACDANVIDRVLACFRNQCQSSGLLEEWMVALPYTRRLKTLEALTKSRQN